MDNPEILVERFGAVTRISHNRPQASNAENTSLLEALDVAIREAEADDEVRAVILAGKGRHFSAGHDLKDDRFKSFDVQTRWDYEEKYYYEYCLRIMDMRKPTIAQVQGACIAGGFMVANMCDLVVCGESAFFQDPVTFSLGTAAIEVLIHPYVMGVRKAKEFLFTGERMTAEQAREIGMVNRVVPDAELERTTLELAQRIAQAPPFAMRVVKRSLNRVWDAQSMRVVMQAHFDAHQAVHEGKFFQQVVKGELAGTIAQAKGVGVAG